MKYTIKKKILVIGNYADFYPRNYLIINAFKKNFEVDEICLWEGKNRKWKFFLALLKAKDKYDYILVLKEGQKFAFILLFYKLFFQSKIIFDAFISYYDTYVFDRKIIEDASLRARYNFLLDWLSCKNADLLIYDTEEHKKYFENKFKIKNKKSMILPVPVDLDLIDSIERKVKDDIFKDKFVILFYGYYIPLQGVEYIVEAAKKLKDKKEIKFLLIGDGQTRKEVEKKYRDDSSGNIEFLDRMDYKELLSYIKMADLNLGIFGNTDKAKRVIPNKVLEAMAANKLVLTGRNKAMERYFINNKDLIYCNMADSDDLAEKIKQAYTDYSRLLEVIKNPRRKIEDNFSQKAIEKVIKENI